MSSGGPPVITVGDTPISVPESLEPDSEGFLDPVSDIGKMAQIPQIQAVPAISKSGCFSGSPVEHIDY